MRDKMVLTGSEKWWLIERPQQQENESQFFDGSRWVTSALVAARFPTEEAAQFIIDEIYGPSNANIMQGAYPVEHEWVSVEERA